MASICASVDRNGVLLSSYSIFIDTMAFIG